MSHLQCVSAHYCAIIRDISLGYQSTNLTWFLIIRDAQLFLRHAVIGLRVGPVLVVWGIPVPVFHHVVKTHATRSLKTRKCTCQNVFLEMPVIHSWLNHWSPRWWQILVPKCVVVMTKTWTEVQYTPRCTKVALVYSLFLTIWCTVYEILKHKKGGGGPLFAK